MPCLRLVPAQLRRAGKPGRIAAAVGGLALVGLPMIGAVANRLRADEAEAAGAGTLGLGAGLLTDPLLAAEVAEANHVAQKQASQVSNVGSSGTDLGAGADLGAGVWSLDSVPDLLGLGGKVVSAGVDGAGEVAKLAGYGVRSLVDIAGAIGGALPDLGDIADGAAAVGKGVGDVLGAIGDGLGDLTV